MNAWLLLICIVMGGYNSSFLLNLYCIIAYMQGYMKYGAVPVNLPLFSHVASKPSHIFFLQPGLNSCLCPFPQSLSAVRVLPPGRAAPVLSAPLFHG